MLPSFLGRTAVNLDTALAPRNLCISELQTNDCAPRAYYVLHRISSFNESVHDVGDMPTKVHLGEFGGTKGSCQGNPGSDSLIRRPSDLLHSCAFIMIYFTTLILALLLSPIAGAAPTCGDVDSPEELYDPAYADGQQVLPPKHPKYPEPEPTKYPKPPPKYPKPTKPPKYPEPPKYPKPTTTKHKYPEPPKYPKPTTTKHPKYPEPPKYPKPTTTKHPKYPEPPKYPKPTTTKHPKYPEPPKYPKPTTTKHPKYPEPPPKYPPKHPKYPPAPE
ncbi:hypothetical protein F5888DRAFT_1746045 [Russula emetica]|nr:hypothetical protein F5888DRAFT_1746045 [Russula emetica]